jgi:hypothetical protein
MLTIGAAALGLAAGANAQSQSTSTQVKSFEIVSVDGNVLVVKEADGAREVTVPPDFLFTVNGKQVPVSELKTGMKGKATITTTVTEKRVYVTEVRNGEVTKALGGGSVIVKATNSDVLAGRDRQEGIHPGVASRSAVTAARVTSSRRPS